MSNLSFDQLVLDNGLQIIGEYNAKALSFASGYFVNTGARDETLDISGVSHFLEHMMFKGTARRSAEDINREFDEIGANYNAYTNEEHTVYYGAVLAERAGQLLDLLSDMMRPALRQTDFDMEKKVILEEIAMYDDRPSFKVFEQGTEAFYNGHPLGQSILGSPDSITALTSEQMDSYFRMRYAPNNMLLAIAGNYEWDKIIEQVSSLTHSWKPQESHRRYPEMVPRLGQNTLIDENVKRAHIAFYAPGVSAQDDLRYAAALIGNCLGDTVGSRLYWSLIDKGLADSASLSHSSSDQSGAFIGYLSTEPEQLEKVADLYAEVLQKVEAEGLKQDEWQRAKQKLATALTLRGETPFGRLMSFGTGYLYTKQHRSVQDVVEAVFATSLEEANTLLARKPFSKLFRQVLSSS